MQQAVTRGVTGSARIAALLLLGSLVGGCSAQPDRQVPNAASPLVAAEAVLDAFYSFDPTRLRTAMADAPTSMPQILYYQGWAQGGNYVVLDRRPCRFENSLKISCDITVKDDLIAALRTGYHVTDTFHFKLQGGRIASIATSSNDPPEFEQALDWLRRERPDVMAGPCRGIFAGGPTPQDCVRAVVKGFENFRVTRRR